MQLGHGARAPAACGSGSLCFLCHGRPGWAARGARARGPARPQELCSRGTRGQPCPAPVASATTPRPRRQARPRVPAGRRHEGGSARLTLSVSLRTFSSERCLHSISCATHSSSSEAEDEAGKEAAIRRSRGGLCRACCCGVRLAFACCSSAGSSVGRGASNRRAPPPALGFGGERRQPQRVLFAAGRPGPESGPACIQPWAGTRPSASPMASHASSEEVGLNELVAALVHQVGR